MSDELVFTVQQSKATPATPISMASIGLRERQHLQEWVISHPEILGSDAKIITFEFGRWNTASGTAIGDRLDVLALDRQGHLIVAELKRDLAADTVTMQAINYAAMASRFSVEALSTVYADHLSDGTSSEQAREQLLDWANDLSDETLGKPKIVLLAGDFGPTVLNTALFLYESGVDLHLRRYRLYRTEADGIVLSISQVLPVRNAEDVMIKPRSSPDIQRESRDLRERRISITDRLIAHRTLSAGDRLKIVVPEHIVDSAAIREWLAINPAYRIAEWRADARQPVMCLGNRRPYSLTRLIQHIVTLATGMQPTYHIVGANWFRDERGRTLNQISDTLT